MISADLLQLLKDRLVGGDAVELEIKDEPILRLIQRAVDRVAPWYFEPRLYESLAIVNSGNGSGHILLTSFSKIPVDIDGIYQIYSVGTLGSLDAQLYGISGNQVYLEELGTYTAWQQFISNARAVLCSHMEWKIINDRVIIHGVAGESKLTFAYRSKVTTIENMTYQKAIDWVCDYSLALTKESLARVRGKYRGGEIEWESDSGELLSEAREDQKALELMLSELDDSMGPER